MDIVEWIVVGDAPVNVEGWERLGEALREIRRNGLRITWGGRCDGLPVRRYVFTDIAHEASRS